MLLLAAVAEEQPDAEEWIDPTDMLNYDATTKTMRRPAEAANYENVPTKRKEYTDSSLIDPCPDITECTRRVAILEEEVQEQKKKIRSASQQPSCTPVFKRYLSKLLNEIQKLGLPNEVSSSVHYDAEVRLSRQAVAEIQKFVTGDGSWKTGALDEALSQILVNFKQHDYEAWKWRFEDTFGVELSTVVGIFVCSIAIVLIICSETWSRVSWFVQFKRLLAICFFISIGWNWLYLYKIAFAEHQNNIVKMESVNEKCTGVKIDWKDNLKEWWRSTWTLQDDPCKKYYEVLIVNPILLVPPTKAISVTITTFFTEPLKHVGQGISEFLRALLQDLPITLQIPVLATIVLSILVFTYGSAQAAIQVGLTRPLRGGHQEPPPPAVEYPHAPQAAIDVVPQNHMLQRQTNQARAGSDARHRGTARTSDSTQHRVPVENVGQAEHAYSEDEMDGEESQGPADTEEQQSGISVNTTHEAPQHQDVAEPKCSPNTDVTTTDKGSAQQRDESSQVSPAAEVTENGKIPHASGEEVENISIPTQESSPHC
ncbi:chloride channel CLIC-like protein 1 isoform X2 [Scleropages formosus]|uniref:chloride channel CLIC-like protein 1 isoform X2 n=1 Tax=Scleropages formosus TaxID=113540 RepID=UPI0010FAAE18|nr:chloride channel CLIC-like protein 1 isoform X2 [Scleropages formosus]